MWMKIDDRLHAHRKTRNLTRSHDDKTRDAAPMGLWVLAGSWSSQNATYGWVPEAELDRWDDDWEDHARRLVRAGYWWPEEHDGEPGFGFNDWEEWNPAGASESGVFGNHVRWHVKKGVVKPDCDHCPKEPTEPEDIDDSSGRFAPDIAPDVAPESGQGIGANRLPVPDPNPIPTRPDPELLSRDKSLETDADLARFDEFWNTYAKKVDRKKAEAKWRLALKRKGVTADLLIESARAYVTWERANNEGGRFVMDPARWLNGHRWEDERPARQAQGISNVQQHLALARRLAEQEQSAQTIPFPQIGGGQR